MKKVLSMMMALLLLVGVMAFVASATGADATLTIETTGTHNWAWNEDDEEIQELDGTEAVKPGDTVILAANLDAGVKFASYELTIKYDTTKMTLMNIYEGDKTLGGFTANTDTGIILDYTARDKKLTGNIFYLEFKVADNAAGLLEVTAEVKGFYYQTQEALNHEVVSGGINIAHDCQWGEGVVTTPATCTEDGVKTYTCSICGETKTEAIPATGHNYDDGVVTTPATCTAEGVMTYTCACGHTKTEKIAKIAHTEVVDAAVPATCTTEGKTEGKHCSVCNTVLVAQETVAKLAHTYTEEVTKAPTCTEKGEKKLTCACGDTKTEEIAVVAHTEVVDAAVAPTCTTEGKTEGKHCSVCNTVLVAQETVAKLAHTYTEEVTKAPTCTEKGEKKLTCACGDTKTEEIAVVAHTEVVDAAVAPTCTEAGKTAGKHCSVCNTVIVAQDVVPATGHTEVVDAAVAATCTTAGKTEGKHCSVCNTVIVAQTEVAALGHTEVVDAAVAATCTTAGKTEGKHCSVCETVLVAQEEVAALGHNDADNDSKCDACGTVVGEPPKTGDVISVVAAVAFVAAMSIVALPKAKKF